MSWSPAGGVRQTYLDAWSKHFGEHYFEFHRCGIAFIGINAQLLGSGLPLESVQREWLKEKVSQFSSDRIFLFSHYPPFLLDEEENEHYDNLGDQGRQEILELIETHSIEALFAGHVHHFWYNCYKNCSCYLLPSTAFTRQDYSEMFRVSPTADFGRNDRAKLGYLLVHVYEDGHDFELIRCDGRESEGTSVAKKPICRIDSVSPRSNQFPVMGFDLRHDWQERVQIPPSGGLDEFDRKIVRNDYAMLALWEMGVQRLRIPFTDLVEDVRRKRVDELVQLGFRFTLFSTLPTDFDVLRKVFDHAHLIDSWEISGHLEESICWAGEIESMPVDHKIQLFFSPLRGKTDIVSTGQTYYHVINHGFTAGELESERLRKLDALKTCFDGIVFRCGIADSVTETIQLAIRMQREFGLLSSVHLRISDDNPASLHDDDTAVHNRLTEAMVHAWASGFDRIFCDTLTDSDRGYFPRKGLLDREYNPRAGARLVKVLHALFCGLGNCRSLELTSENSGLLKLSSTAEFGSFIMLLLPAADLDRSRHTDELVDVEAYWLNWTDGSFSQQFTHQDTLPLVRVKSDYLRSLKNN